MSVQVVKALGMTVCACLMVVFLSNEYHFWLDRLACNEKCEVLGCRSGTLISGEDRSDLLCRCNDDMDYLVILD
ncbi:hypothetical protein [Pseudoalteromonas luteoviolacea]|uniref:hypothetical protein n=1 Tax=Pseudoalteromonas luteoviolacea TaxID=43657 RepID=UPI000AAB8F7A|nr:hypothetical protein [Pseudoalteromonas luteoviolacea]